MKKLYWVLACGLFCLVIFPDVNNADKPLKGEWDLRPQKVWESDKVGDAPFDRPSELRASPDGMLYFHDFGRNISHVFDSDGRNVSSFAGRGDGAGEVDRYLNCFIAGDKVAIGTPGKLHFFSKRGAFSESFENNLFARFPLCFLNDHEFFFTPQQMGPSQDDKIRIMRFDLRTGQESPLAEFPAPAKGQAGLPVIVLGLTPQVKMDIDARAGKIFYGRSDEYAIHVSDLKGLRLFSFGLDRKGKAASEEEKRGHFEKSGIPKDRYEKFLPALPGELTQFMRIQTAGDLVFVYSTESLDRQQEKIAMDIFSAEGKYLYRTYLRLGDTGSLYTHVEKLALIGNHCYALLQDGSGRNFLAKYKISLPSAE